MITYHNQGGGGGGMPPHSKEGMTEDGHAVPQAILMVCELALLAYETLK